MDQIYYIKYLTHCHHCVEKNTIHQITTMLSICKYVLFPGHNHLLITGADDTSLKLSPLLFWLAHSFFIIIFIYYSLSLPLSPNSTITFTPLPSCSIEHSPTLYSQVTGEKAYVESKIFPHLLLLCSISYACFSSLTINQHFINSNKT